jgi:hypothetical protein
VVAGTKSLAAVALAALLAGCSASTMSSPSPTPTPAGSSARVVPAPESDWLTYHHDNARTGVATGLTPVGTLSRAWEAKLDGAVYGQPLVVGDLIFAATEGDSIYALQATTGAVVWSVHLGTPMPLSQLPCGNIDPLGITSTMVYDKDTGLVFALAEMAGGAHVLFGVDASTGAVRLRRTAEPPTRRPSRASAARRADPAGRQGLYRVRRPLRRLRKLRRLGRLGPHHRAWSTGQLRRPDTQGRWNLGSGRRRCRRRQVVLRRWQRRVEIGL